MDIRVHELVASDVHDEKRYVFGPDTTTKLARAGVDVGTSLHVFDSQARFETKLFQVMSKVIGEESDEVLHVVVISAHGAHGTGTLLKANAKGDLVRLERFVSFPQPFLTSASA